MIQLPPTHVATIALYEVCIDVARSRLGNCDESSIEAYARGLCVGYLHRAIAACNSAGEQQSIHHAQSKLSL